MTAQTTETRIGEAIQRSQTTASDSYDNVSVFSIYWKSDDTSAEDSSLFIQTLSKLQNVQTRQRGLSDDDIASTLIPEIYPAASQSGSRKLFVLHYAGHAIAGSTTDSLIIVPKIGQELGRGPQLNMSLIKDVLKDKSALGLDVLLVLDCCCARAKVAGQGEKAKGARVELMAGTAPKGISNPGEDGWTFTQHWCETFTKLLEIGTPFTCDDIVKDLTPDSEPEQFPSTFVLREGQDLPITFRRHPGPIEPATATSRSVVTHIEENPDALPLKQLINELPVPTSGGGTLLLLRIPVFLQEFLVPPGVVLS